MAEFNTSTRKPRATPTEPEEFWSNVQDDIRSFQEIGDAQHDARRPGSVAGSFDEEDRDIKMVETPYNSSGRPIEDSWHPFLPVSPCQVMTSPALAPSIDRTYDFEALVDVPSDPESQHLVRRAIERTLNEVLNASEFPELHDVVRAYWDHVEKEMPSPAPSE
ncbi:hypothetical protein BDU57DRAFT_570019 [Ampelomyces quisqualis]|uniref:Uncharacterized protein n=1 Tax=Ampelomyces quisqualis TaxID=50730 RepID=A0A6A5QWS4_AMPQU|nr:hypothetical protein BDU57DRAFT_570019 [Ampelomyces quisqualis]